MGKNGEVVWWTKEGLMDFFNTANREVAILCNHQKAVSKNFDEGTAKMEEKIAQLKKEKRLLKKANATAIKMQQKSTQILKAEAALQAREDNKTVSLSTSKINYIDPRVSVQFCKKVELPIEKVFTTAIRVKFPWAMHQDTTFRF